jgi:flagellar biosynthesis chaperone FliJ
MRRWLGNSAQDWPPKQIMDRFITQLNDVIAKEKQAKASKQDSLNKEEKNTATNKPETKERPLALRFLTHTRA